MNKSKPNISLLVVSCDSYSDLWKPFFNNFFYFWNNCPININLLSNYKSFDHPKINNIKVGKDISWSDNLMKAINKLESDYILLILEDMLINKKVSNKYFEKINLWINNKSPDYLRLCISHKPEYFDNLIGKIQKITPYKTSTMPCVWKKSVLTALLMKGESAWDFEIKGSKRARDFDEFYAVYNNFITYKNCIIKGKWRRSIVKKKNNYGLDITNLSRPVMTLNDEYEYSFRKFRSILFNRLPNKIRTLLKGKTI